MASAALKVTKLQAIKLQAYIRDAGDTLGLSGWSLTLDLSPIDSDDALAEVQQTENQHGFIKFRSDFLTFEPEMQKNIIAHELAHLHLTRIDDLIAGLERVFVDGARGAKQIDLARKSFVMLHESYEAANEQVTETFARLVTRLLPLPRFGKTRHKPTQERPILSTESAAGQRTKNNKRAKHQRH